MLYLIRFFTILDLLNHIACISFLHFALNASAPFLSVYQQSLFSVSRSLLLLALVFPCLTLPGSSPLLWMLSICLKLPAFLVAVYFTISNHQALLSLLGTHEGDPASMISLALISFVLAFVLHLVQLGASLFAWLQK